jgi:hypothetical protein
MSDLFDFISAIKNHWVAVVSVSGALFVVQFLINRIPDLPFLGDNSKGSLIVFLRWIRLETNKRGYSIAIIIFLISVISGSFQAWKEERAVNNKEIVTLGVKEILGKAITDGEKILTACRQQDQKECLFSAQPWGDKIDDFILKAFGSGEQAAFENLSGYIFYGGNDLVHKIDGSIRRLNELLQRSSTIPLRRDFDITKYK